MAFNEDQFEDPQLKAALKQSCGGISAPSSLRRRVMLALVSMVGLGGETSAAAGEHATGTRAEPTANIWRRRSGLRVWLPPPLSC